MQFFLSHSFLARLAQEMHQFRIGISNVLKLLSIRHNNTSI